jgi:hypothetical protein
MTEDEYIKAYRASVDAGQNFSDYARQAVAERLQREASSKARQTTRLKPTYVSPTGALWEKDLPCWCGECHDPFAVHGDQTTTIDIDNRHTLPLGAKTCNAQG